MESHGEYKLNVVDHVIEIKVISAWNEITATKFVEEFKSLAKPLKEFPWGL